MEILLGILGVTAAMVAIGAIFAALIYGVWRLVRTIGVIPVELGFRLFSAIVWASFSCGALAGAGYIMWRHHGDLM